MQVETAVSEDAAAPGTRLPNPFLVFLLLCSFGATFFLLPYAFPVRPTLSASYVYHFNNKIATPIFLVSAILFALYTRGLSLRPSQADSQIRSRTALVSGGIFVAAAFLLSIPVRLDALIGESIYFLDRMTLLAAGHRIYREFEFAYGPMLLWPAIWISRLSHACLLHGYLFVLLLSWALGIWLLQAVLNRIEIVTPHRTIIFFLMLANLFPATMGEGINYSPIRFLLTSATALLVFSLRKRRLPLYLVFASAVVCASLATLVSPEFGIAFMAGTALFFGLFAREKTPGFWLAFVAMLVGFGLIATLAERAGVYITLHAFADGALNYPILPGIGTLSFLFLFLIAGCAAYSAWHRGEADSLLIYLVCVSVFCLPSAFGRADPGHMELGAMPAVLVAALAISTRRLLWIPIVVLQLFGSSQFLLSLATPVREGLEVEIFDPAAPNPIRLSIVALARHFHQEQHLQIIEAKVAAHRASFARIDTLRPDPNTLYNAPFGYHDSRGYLLTNGNIDYGYFHRMENEVTPEEIQSSIRWLEETSGRPLILPLNWKEICYVFKEGSPQYLKSVYGFPLLPPARRTMDLYWPLCNYIVANYREQPADPAEVWHYWKPATKP